MSTFVIHPLPAGEVDTSAPTAVRQASDGSNPCRRCLRDAAAGDPLVLAAYDPFTGRTPYAGEGPVFVHADGCERFPSAPGAMSERLGGRMLSIRAYDGDAMLVSAAVMRGEHFAERVGDLLHADGVAFLHVHFAGPGCFWFRVDRV